MEGAHQTGPFSRRNMGPVAHAAGQLVVEARQEAGATGFRFAAGRVPVLALTLLLFACAQAPSYPEPSASFFEEITATVTIDGSPLELAGAKVERPFFESTGVAPLVGRLFADVEYIGAERPAVILSHALWQDTMGADPATVGTRLDIDGIAHTIVGIMPPGFDSPSGTRFWIAAPPAPVVFENVRVFDGERVIPAATVVVENRRITQIAGAGDPVAMPSGARRVDGSGKTLLPGLIDAHTHSGARDNLKGAVAFGVTTHLDMFTPIEFLQEMKREQEAGMAADRADLLSAGTLVTAPGGHGTQYGVDIPTLSTPEDADAFVAARIGEGSDYIKLVSEDGAAFGVTLPTLDDATLAAVVEAAHARGKLAVVHVGTQKAARSAIAAGADGLMHVFGEEPPDADFAGYAAQHGVFVVPTLSVLESVAGEDAGEELLADPRLDALLLPAGVAGLQRPDTLEGSRVELDNALAAVAALHDAGVPLLAGTDAPNPGTYFGASMHRELELLVRAGLSPVEALAAATSVAADAFGLDDRGRIAAGKRADLLLVDGDPTADILDSRAIAGIWKEGRRWKLELLRAQVEAVGRNQ